MWIPIWQLAPSWILLGMNFDVKAYSGTSFSVPVTNFAWIRSTLAKLLPFNWFQNGGRRHLEIISRVYFVIWSFLGSCCWCSCKIYTSIYCWFIKLCQNIESGVRHHLELLFGNPGPPMHCLLGDLKSVFKFHVNPFTTFRDLYGL